MIDYDYVRWDAVARRPLSPNPSCHSLLHPIIGGEAARCWMLIWNLRCVRRAGLKKFVDCRLSLGGRKRHGTRTSESGTCSASMAHLGLLFIVYCGAKENVMIYSMLAFSRLRARRGFVVQNVTGFRLWHIQHLCTPHRDNDVIEYHVRFLTVWVAP